MGGAEGNAVTNTDKLIDAIRKHGARRTPDLEKDTGIDEHGQRIALTKSAQVRMCGNSVCPPLAQALVAANLSDMAVRRVAA